MLYSKIAKSILDGSLTFNQICISGRFRGYYTVIQPIMGNGGHRLEISASSPEDPGNTALGEHIQQIRANYGGINHVYVRSNSVAFDLGYGANKKFVEFLDPFVRDIVSFLEAGGYTSGCANCGSQEQVDCYNINGENVYLCPNCLEKVRAGLEAKKEVVRANKSNLLHGFAGAMIGALAGGIVYVLLNKLGYVSALSGLLMAFLALLLYEKFGGCLDIKGVICCAVILIATVYFSNKLAWTWEVFDQLKSYGWRFGEVYSELGSILKDSDLTGTYTASLLQGYLFTALGAVGKFIMAVRTSTGKYTIKKNK